MPFTVSRPTSTSVCGVVAHAPGTPSALGVTGKGFRPWIEGETTVSAWPNQWRLVTAATVIASGADPGEPALPRPKSSRSLPAAITGTTPAAATLRIVGIIASFAGSLSGPPPEKLITFIPSVTALSKAATIWGVSAKSPPTSGAGTLKTR